ncbi:MAG TPA: hypothetical protein VFV73_40550 [Streptosporangiaceae bacterium]|nr:hypothetical protein [Streptosporangiaceae bacterium]
MQFAAHADALHEAPGGVVTEEAVRGDPVHAEVLEAVAEELTQGFGGVAVPVRAGSRTQPSSAWVLRAWPVTSAWVQAPSMRSMKSPMTVLPSSATMVVASRAGSVNLAR